MEVMLHSIAKAPQRAVVRLKARAALAPLSIELTVDPHVYLHAAELVQAVDVHGRLLPQAYKDESSALWRQVELVGRQEMVEFGVSWLAIANANPRAEYAATLTVRDVRGALVEPCPGSQNPARTPGLIGPRHNPTDIGGLLVHVLPADDAAASAATSELRS